MQIVILGMHRSGTSMVTRAINLMGAYLGSPGDLVPATPDNPAGFWEREDVVELGTELFRAAGSEWFDPLAFDVARMEAGARAASAEKIRSILQRLDAHPTWVLKDPRMCLMLDLWRPLLTQPLLVIAHRSPLEVARSLASRDFFPLEFGLALWEIYTVASLTGSRGAPRVLVSYNECLRDPDAALGRLHRDLQAAGAKTLQWIGKDSSSLVQARLYREKAAGREEERLLTAPQQRLQQALLSGEAIRDDFPCAVSPEARATMEKHLGIVRRLQEHLRDLLARLKERDRLMGDLVLTGRSITASYTWRAGNLLTGWLRRIAMRRQPGAEWPEDHVERLARDIEDLWAREGRLERD